MSPPASWECAQPGSRLPHPGRTLREIRALDDLIYGELRERDNPNAVYWQQLASVFPDQTIYLLDEKGCGVGNLHFIPLLPEQFASVICGKFTDALVTPYTLHHALRSKPLHLHLTSFLIAPKHRGLAYSKQMWNEAARIWRRVGKIEELCSVAWMPTATRFLDPLCWRPTTVRDMDGHRVYRLSPQDVRIPEWKDRSVRTACHPPLVRTGPLVFDRE